MVKKMKKNDPESTRGSGSPSDINHVTPCPCLPSLVDVRFRVRRLSCLHNDRQNDHITSALLVEILITSAEKNCCAY